MHNKLPPVDTVMDFPPRRSLIKDFGSSFMGSLLLLNAQRQEKRKKKKTFRSEAVSSNHQYRADTLEWFHRSQPTGGGRQFGPSHPVRTETVNTAMPPAVLSGTIGGGEGRGGERWSERTHLSLPSSFPQRAKKLSLVSRSAVMYVRISEFNYRCLLATPVIFPFQSYALGASQCRTLSPKSFLL